jgi:hypothetical protein
MQGRSSKGPTADISRENSAWPIGAAPGRGPTAGVAALLFFESRDDAVRRAREFRRKLRESNAGIRLLAELAKRHAELQKVVRRLAVIRIFLIALGEGDRGILVAAAHIVCLAKPILCIARQVVVGVLGEKGAQRLFGIVVLRLTQQIERILILALHRIGRKLAACPGYWLGRRCFLGRGRSRAGRWLHLRGLQLTLGQRAQRLRRERGLLQGLVRIERLGAGRSLRRRRGAGRAAARRSAGACDAFARHTRAAPLL